MSECPKSPSGRHSWVPSKYGEECLWCHAIKGKGEPSSNLQTNSNLTLEERVFALEQHDDLHRARLERFDALYVRYRKALDFAEALRRWFSEKGFLPKK